MKNAGFVFIYYLLYLFVLSTCKIIYFIVITLIAVLYFKFFLKKIRYRQNFQPKNKVILYLSVYYFFEKL